MSKEGTLKGKIVLAVDDDDVFLAPGNNEILVHEHAAIAGSQPAIVGEQRCRRLALPNYPAPPMDSAVPRDQNKSCATPRRHAAGRIVACRTPGLSCEGCGSRYHRRPRLLQPFVRRPAQPTQVRPHRVSA